MTEGGTWRAGGVFVGREAQLADLVAAVGTTRLVALTGPPGVGKTRLAHELSARIGGGYPDGTCFMELATVSNPELVPVAVARALSVWEQHDRPVVDSIVARLSSRRLLLVLDNCEHILQGCAELAVTLLDACPGLTILATSQEALGVSGERVWPVPPLSVPHPGATTEQLAASDAVALFCARAQAVQPSFQVTEAKLEMIANICRRLDGIPLAISLAAPRVTVVTLRELAERLDDRLAVLTDNSVAATPRHQTLRTALEWSYGLLSEPEQALLQVLAVFPAGCTADAAAAVCGNAKPRRLRESLAGLVAKSLVLGEGGAEPRYRMLESIRLFAAECLSESGEDARVRARQAQWCVAFMEQAEPALTGRDQIRWLGVLDEEYGNLSMALNWALAERDAEMALRLAGALTIYWRVRGYFREGLDTLRAALALDPEQPKRLRIKALWGVGLMSVMLGRTAASSEAEESLALAHEAGDLQGQARALLILGNRATLDPAEPAEALDLFARSADLARESGDGWCLAHALGMSGFFHLQRGDSKAARHLLERCIREGRRNGDQQSLRLGLLLRGDLAATGGEPALARALLTEGLAIARALLEPYSVSVALSLLGGWLASQGDLDRAREMLEQSIALARELGATTSVGATLLKLADLERDEGDLAAARRDYTAVLTTGLSNGQLLGLGELAMAGGEWEKARQHLEDAHAEALRSKSMRLVAASMAALGRLARAKGDFTRTVTLHAESLSLRRKLGDMAGIAQTLEDMAGVAAELGASRRAARLLGVAAAFRERGGYVRPTARQPRYDADVAVAKARLGAEQFEVWWQEGTRLPVARALAYAADWKGTGGDAVTGWQGLTRKERRVASLVATGMTNAEVATTLTISPLTVATHLTRIFATLGIASRRELRGAGPGAIRT